MKKFAELYDALDSTNKTNAKVRLLQDYFAQASHEDIIWALYFFSGRRPRRQISSKQIRDWLGELSGLPLWLIEEAYHIVGDLSETVSKLLPPPSHPMERNLTDWVEIINGFAAQTEEERKAAILAAWDALETNERFVFNKFITGGWRIGVSQQLVVKALGQHTGIDAQILAHRVMGNWEPANFTYEQLVQDEQEGASLGSRPYPFALAYQLDVPVENLGDVDDWQIEWKWDGIRAQIIRRDGEHFVWSRGEDLITDRFPEFKLLNEILPEGTVLDGEILCFSGDVPLPFNVLQTRIGRKNITPKILKEAPVKLVVYDLLELGGADLRQKPMAERRFLLERNLTEWDIPELLVPSPVVRPESWAAAAELRKEARARLTEGFMLKRRDSVYGVGRKKGEWWKWKIDPLTVDGVLVYAQKGTGKRANLFTDYTFAVWNEGELVPFAKAYSGLTDKEIARVDHYIRHHTIDKFGPVRTVTPKLVMEIGFEGILASGRHKSGVALRFPRILRIRDDKPMEEADTLQNLKNLLVHGNG